MVKVLSNTTVSTGFETQTQNEERPVRGQTLQEGEVHENRRKGRSENRRETWFVSRHYELRTEV